MSEEIKENGREIGEAELESVSGGGSSFAEETAKMVCAECRDLKYTCHGGEQRLIDLIGRQGYAPAPWDCPFRG